MRNKIDPIRWIQGWKGKSVRQEAGMIPIPEGESGLLQLYGGESQLIRNDIIKMRRQEIEWILAGGNIETSVDQWNNGERVILTRNALGHRMYRFTEHVGWTVPAGAGVREVEREELWLREIPAILAQGWIRVIQDPNYGQGGIVDIEQLAGIGFPIFKWIVPLAKEIKKKYGRGHGWIIYANWWLTDIDGQGGGKIKGQFWISGKGASIEGAISKLFKALYERLERGYDAGQWDHSAYATAAMTELFVWPIYDQEIAVSERKVGGLPEWIEKTNVFTNLYRSLVTEKCNRFMNMDVRLGACLLECHFWLRHPQRKETMSPRNITHYRKEYLDYWTMIEHENPLLMEICWRGDLAKYLDYIRSENRHIRQIVILSLDKCSMWVYDQIGDSETNYDLREVLRKKEEWREFVRRICNLNIKRVIWVIHHAHMVETTRTILERLYGDLRKGAMIGVRVNEKLEEEKISIHEEYVERKHCTPIGTPIMENNKKRIWKDCLSNYREFFLDIECLPHRVSGAQTPFLIVLRERGAGHFIEFDHTGGDPIDQFWEWFDRNIIEAYMHEMYGDNTDGKHKKARCRPGGIQHKIRFWAHNGSRYDWVILFRELQLRRCTFIGSATNMKGLVYEDVIFADFAKVIPGSLDSIAQSWIGRGKTGGFDDWRSLNWDNLPEKFEGLRKYCENDVLILEECVLKYFEMTREMTINKRIAGKATTVYGVWHEDIWTSAQLGLSMWINGYNKDLWEGIPETWYKEIKSSYFGGYTQVLGQGPYGKEDNLYYYDINSSYPAVMLGAMPCVIKDGRRQYEVPKEYNEEYKRESQNEIRLLLVSWELDAEVNFSKLAVRLEDGTIIYPRSQTTPIWKWDCEVEQGRGKIMVYGHMSWVGGTHYPFKEFINEIYNLRCEAKGRKEEAKSAFYKLLMNSVYGKFGQKRYKQTLVGTLCEIHRFLSQNAEMEMTVMRNLKGGLFEAQLKHHQEMNDIQYFIHWASYITARARSNLLLDENVVYCDTDSVIRHGELSSELIDKNRLGAWKLEGRLDYGFFLAPKLYYLEYASGEIHIKAKGINSKQWCHEYASWRDGTIEIGKTIRVPENQIFKRISGEIFVLSVEKILRPRNIRRRWIDSRHSTIIENVEEWKNNMERLKQNESEENMIMGRRSVIAPSIIMLTQKKLKTMDLPGDINDVWGLGVREEIVSSITQWCSTNLPRALEDENFKKSLAAQFEYQQVI